MNGLSGPFFCFRDGHSGTLGTAGSVRQSTLIPHKPNAGVFVRMSVIECNRDRRSHRRSGTTVAGWWVQRPAPKRVAACAYLLSGVAFPQGGGVLSRCLVAGGHLGFEIGYRLATATPSVSVTGERR